MNLGEQDWILGVNAFYRWRLRCWWYSIHMRKNSRWLTTRDHLTGGPQVTNSRGRHGNREGVGPAPAALMMRFKSQVLRFPGFEYAHVPPHQSSKPITQVAWSMCPTGGLEQGTFNH